MGQAVALGAGAAGSPRTAIEPSAPRVGPAHAVARRVPLLTVSFVLLLLLVCFPFVASIVVPSLAAWYVAALFLMHVQASRGAPEAEHRVLTALVGLVLLVGVWLLVSRVVGAPPALLLTALFLAPASLALGWRLDPAVRWPAFSLALRVVGLASAGVAFAERAAGANFFGESGHVEDGVFRVAGGQLHPILLGLTLCVSLSAAVDLRHAWQRAAYALVMLGAIAATSSLTALAVGTAAAPLVVLPGLRRAAFRAAPVAFAAGAVAVAVLAVLVWRPEVPGLSLTDYSNGYRFALYALAPQILAAHPLGWGIGGPPAGALLFDTQAFGVRDVSLTIDSEPVLLIAQFGWIGLLLFAVAVLITLSALRTAPAALALALLTVVLNSLTVAVHPWLSVCPLWCVLLGMALRARSDRRARSGATRG